MQSQGIGKILLNDTKDKRNELRLNVYRKNTRAISFTRGKVLRSRAMDWMKLLEKKNMQWCGKKRKSCLENDQFSQNALISSNEIEKKAVIYFERTEGGVFFFFKKFKNVV